MDIDELASSISRPRFSVVTPLYNKARYLAECVSSVKAQAVPDWEMLIVDDGSTDGSEELARELAREDARIQLLQHPGGKNMGVNASRNLAIAHSVGQFISFIDADDTWLPGRLLHDLDIFSKFPEANAVISRTIYWWDDNSAYAEIDCPFIGPSRLVKPGSLFLTSYVTGETQAPCTCAVSIRREVVSNLEPWDPNYSVGGDLKYFAELVFRNCVYVSDRCLSEYRRLSEGVWSTGRVSGAEAKAHKALKGWMRILVNTSSEPDSTTLGEIRRLSRAF